MFEPLELEVIAGNGRESSDAVTRRGKFSLAAGHGTASFSFAGGILAGEFRCAADCFVRSISVTGTVPADDRSAFLKNGFQSWSFSGALGMYDIQKRSPFRFVHALHENTENVPSGEPGKHVSEFFCFIGNRASGEGTIFAQEPPFGQYLSFFFDASRSEGNLRITWDLGKNFRRGERLTLDPVTVSEGLCTKLLERWADSVARREKLSFNQSMRVGWCSWYRYFTKIDPDLILSDLHEAKKRRIPFDFFQIDDGWQRCVGDWLALKPSFSGRMRELADEIRSAGFAPGLWLAPFITTRKSPAFSKPGWVLRDEKGKPVTAGWNPNWGGPFSLPFYALDITNPEVQDYIRTVISAVTKEWGFSYLKLDFLYAASLPGVRCDMSLTRAEVLREGLSLIRECAPGAVILGCGAPLSASVGLVDAMRIGCDVSPRWKENPIERLLSSDSNLSTEGAIRSTFVRSFMDKRFWINDPDCLMLRSSGTKLSIAERRTLFHAILTAGGMLVLSDSLSRYGAKETGLVIRALDLFKKTSKGKTRALDLLEQKTPELFYNDRGYLCLCNFGEKPEVVIFSKADLARCGVDADVLVDVGSGESFEIKGETVFRLGAHDSRMFRIEV